MFYQDSGEKVIFDDNLASHFSQSIISVCNEMGRNFISLTRNFISLFLDR